MDAEVEVYARGRSERRIVDLVKAIRSNRSTRLFLVLGDPGGGKSVALRHLTRAMLAEVGKSGILPIYVNLKEWEQTKPWSEANPPTSAHLRKFIVSYLTNLGDIFVRDFVNTHFVDMWDRGRIFFLFDSFDEIPALLDQDESSELVRRLSLILNDFISGPHDSRGVIASRNYRRPIIHSPSSLTLEIRPLSELKVREVLLRSPALPTQVVTELLAQRPGLLSSARNPFVAHLLVDYLKHHQFAHPDSQYDLFASFFDQRLSSLNSDIAGLGLNSAQIQSAAIDLAYFMYREPLLGLEAPVKQILRSIPIGNLDQILEILRRARIVRRGPLPNESISFVHRRFNEFFVARKYLAVPGLVDLEAITEDRRERDALALYAEVADVQTAKNIAAYCWREVRGAFGANSQLSGSENQKLRAIFALRFLTDAFTRSRPDAIAEFRNELTTVVTRCVRNHRGDLLAAKLALEAVGLLGDRAAARTIHRALDTGNAWLGNTALRSCRYLATATNTLTWRVSRYLASLTDVQVLARGQEILYGLSLANALKRVRTIFILEVFDTYLAWLLVFSAVIFLPAAIAIIALLHILARLLPTLGRNRFGRTFMQIMSPRVQIWVLLASFGVSRSLELEKELAQRMPGGFGTEKIEFLGPLFGLVEFSEGFENPLYFYLVIIGAVIAMPFSWKLEFVRFLRTAIVRGYWSDVFKMMRSVLIAPVALAIAFGLLAGVVVAVAELWPSTIGRLVVLCIFLVAPAFMLVWALCRACLWTKRFIADTLALSRAHPAPTRPQIAELFGLLRTGRGRERYVAALETMTTMRGMVPTGSWPAASAPNLDDAASIRLAQLDEQWRGFVR